MGDDNSLRVAVRVRPQSEREKADLNRICTTVYHNDSQINIGGQKNFTFDHAFDSGTQQQKIYDECVKGLVEGTFDGFNATVLAYGQTGSGKTYTMGTAFDMMDVMNENDIGIVPRAIQHLFSEMESRKQQALEQGFVEPCFDIVAQFVELYNEEIIDLLSHERVPTGLRIHEDVKGEIFLNGVTRIAVTNPVQTLEVLKNGSLNRKTASTNMNKQSSRSHAIFTMIIKQQRTVATKACDSQRALEQNNVNPPQDEDSTTELELLSAKFHFVDLAGSERLKRSGATGDRAREGISINFGLLALGNVICSLTATPVPGKVTYIPYRDSKLTRLLQDSLGGNSRTVMIACISPSDCDYVETLNTLNYANRAKNIKNKVIANQDKSSKVIGRLRSRIAELEAELLDFRQGRIKILDGIESFSDQYRENVLLQADVSQLRIRIKAMQETLEMLTARNVQLLAENSEIRAQMGILRDQNCHESHGDVSIESKKEGNNGLSDVIRVYIGELESLRCSLMESNATNEQLRQQLNHWKTQATKNAFRLPLHTLNTNKDVVNCSLNDNVEKVIACTPVTSLIQEAKADVERMKQSITESSHEGDRTNSELTDHEDDTMKTSIMVVNSDSDGDVEELKGIEDEDLEVENEAEAECLKLGDDLAELQAEISIKERLILKLEHSERRLAEVQLMYQRKIAEFSLRIKEMEAERDRVLAEMASKQPQKVVDTNHVRKIREDYEKKLATMRDEFKKLQSIEREHRKMQTKQAAKELERSRILSELNELKKAKVKLGPRMATLLRKIKEESNRAKSHETSIMKKIAGLEKEARRKDDIIQKLQNKDRQREEALKKSFNEVGRLRQLSRQASHNSGRKSERQRNLHLPQAQRPTSRTSVEMKVKAKWMIIEKLLRQRIIQRQTITKLENELEKAVTEKNALNEEIGRLEEDYIEEKDSDKRDLIGEHIDGCHAKMLYIMEHLSELRNTMAGIDENNKETTLAQYVI
ncbi:unnamed protein product [Thelazia callipaeda]|uniref:Kinesin-like protein n=1 Tax=Thelazia callipaeda TaxID=103827 RepID=A0A0N5CW38_THECL|nr:unnamed protein product [Thelazia callipaeda]